jgi:membrane-bound ClpP family serine protease
LSYRTLWLGTAAAAVVLFIGGLTMFVLSEDKHRTGLILTVGGLMCFVFSMKNATSALREERLNALETRFKELPAGISAQRIDIEDKRWQIIHTDRLIKIRCESACAVAAKTIKEVSRFKSSFPAEAFLQIDDISTWFTVLTHLRLGVPSQGELPSRNPTLENIAGVSVAACAKLRELL